MTEDTKDGQTSQFRGREQTKFRVSSEAQHSLVLQVHHHSIYVTKWQVEREGDDQWEQLTTIKYTSQNGKLKNKATTNGNSSEKNQIGTPGSYMVSI